MKTISEIATENHINKICIDGYVKDFRQLDKSPFEVVPDNYYIMENTIYNEPMLFCDSY